MDRVAEARPETPLVRRSTPRLKWLLGGVLVVSGIVALGAWGVTSPGAVSYFVTPSEVAAKGPAVTGRPLRLGGRVAPASLSRDASTVRFSVSDGHHAVPVRFSGEVPDTLRENTDVVAEGTLDSRGTLVATRVLAKCSSRFVPAVEREARAAR